ncbi:MAG: aldo/keto reductase [Defluviitaleaceae bacterium]|nr:aldo/keto reductase [Defluviitaleaceae bacterium]
MTRKDFKGKPISHLGMGAMRLPQVEEGWGKPVLFEKGAEIIDYLMAQGVNYFDTAYVYHGGDSERFLGRALQKYPRESYFLADKYNLLAQPDYRIQFPEQLERLQTDYIDFYLCHGISDNHIKGYLGNGGVEYFLEEKAKGRIKNLGFSFHGRPSVLRQALKYTQWDFVMIQLNYYDWFHGPAKEQYEILQEHNIPVMAMEPAHGGLLARLNEEGAALLQNAEPNRSLASWAFRFLLDLNITVILSGMSNMEQAQDNIATFQENKPLTLAEKELIHAASSSFFKSIGATCTFCRYCDGCPHKLDIPELLRIYNDYRVGGDWRLKRMDPLPPSERPSQCTGCGICVGQCPQSLDIPKFMAEMAGKGY